LDTYPNINNFISSLTGPERAFSGTNYYYMTLLDKANISAEEITEKRKQIGAELKKFREASGKSMDQLGAEMGTGKSTISKIEAGKWNFGIETLITFAKYLNVDITLKPKR
jgi:DNA-binding XRE family transcriptional regulator